MYTSSNGQESFSSRGVNIINRQSPASTAICKTKIGKQDPKRNNYAILPRIPWAG